MNTQISMSVTEAAGMLGVSRAKMYQLIHREDADYVFRIDGKTLISRSKLEEWVKRQCEGGTWTA